MAVRPLPPAVARPLPQARRRTAFDSWLFGVILAATLIGAVLRLPLVSRFPLREDEAIYAFWALHGAHVDPLFLTVWPDKPPLFLWLFAATFQFGGATPVTARLLNVVLSTTAIPLVAMAAYRWWGKAAAVAAAVALALNPFAISFGPTAYTDPLLVCAGAGAVALVAWRRFFWAGALLGAAIMTKQQGLLFVPLVAALGAWELRGAGGKAILRSAGLCLVGALLVTGPILYWDSLRWAVAPSPWDLGARNVGGVALAAPALWPARAQAWLALAGYLVASRWFAAGLLVVMRRPGRQPVSPAHGAAPALCAGADSGSLGDRIPGAARDHDGAGVGSLSAAARAAAGARHRRLRRAGCRDGRTAAAGAIAGSRPGCAGATSGSVAT